MKDELEALFGRRVDIIERRLLEHSDNYIRRRHILSHMETLYVAGCGVAVGYAQRCQESTGVSEMRNRDKSHS